MIWKPHVTVAAVIEQDNRFLMVRETINGQEKINQPAGHLEQGESLIDAVIRETIEETTRDFQPQYLIGIYQWRHPENTSYLRFAFAGHCGEPDDSRELDPDINQAEWMTIDELNKKTEFHRSPLVMQCIDDYLAGKQYPFELLTYLD